MPFEQRDNSGSLFVNSRKTRDNHPDRQGTALIDGQEYWVSGWVKKTKTGENWLSMAFTKKEAEGNKSSPKDNKQYNDDLDSDIPF